MLLLFVCFCCCIFAFTLCIIGALTRFVVVVVVVGSFVGSVSATVKLGLKVVVLLFLIFHVSLDSLASVLSFGAFLWHWL